MLVLNILIGIALLLLGRKLFWLFVAGIGFVVAVGLVQRLFTRLEVETSTLVLVLIGLVAGIIGALLAIFLQRAAVAIVGFAAGGYIVFSLLDLLQWGQGTLLPWALALVGGIVGVVLAGRLLEWALIILSSLSGAFLLAQSAGPRFPPAAAVLLTLLVLVVAAAVGLVVQSRAFGKEKK
ncbi:MAG: hypothetical protein JXM73_16010 [Anaerolineae bacterium]|nr:hypothetical protein [Anaerolineae bacterium]